jgi:hypothetical protein
MEGSLPKLKFYMNFTMKTLILFFIIVITSLNLVKGQINVSSNGTVGIGTLTSSSNFLQVTGILNYNGLSVSTPPNNSGSTYGIFSKITEYTNSTTTAIKYYIPETVQNAIIYIYDMNGKQLKSYTISMRGNNLIIINGSEFNPGMYLYTLIADSKEIDTKRMILTE